MTADLILMLGIIFSTIIMPGPDMMLITRYSLDDHPKSAFMCNLGITLGLIVHVIFAFLGLAALIAAGGLLYTVAKTIGALYLIYLGYSSFSSPQILDKKISQKTTTLTRAFRDGFFTNLLNVKVMIFFLVIFTQVIDPDYTLFQKLIFVAVLLLMSFSFWSFFSKIIQSKKVFNRLKTHEAKINKSFGLLIIAFGVLLAFSA